MSSNVTIGGQTFVCVALKDADFRDVAAIYVILCVQEGGKWKILDVGQTGELGQRIDSHDRRSCWERNCPNKNIWVCVYPMPTSKYTKEDRLKFEKALRAQYKPPCGER
jgi:hypothetical protein